MGPGRMPPAEVATDPDLVARLLSSQFPQWAALPVRPLPGTGWDNALFRLGAHLVARLPRRRLGADLVAKEHRWLPELAPLLPLPVPVPVGRGEPGEGYPWAWSVCPWLPGEMAATVPLADPTAVGAALGGFVAALHAPAPSDAPGNEFRAVPLAARDEMTRRTVTALGNHVDAGRVAGAWKEAMDVPGWDGPAVWVHGDLHPGNLLVASGALSAVLDFGDLCAGDPAVDLISAWMLLPAPARPAFRERAGVDGATWARGRGWALTIGLACLANSADNPVVAGIGRRGVTEALADASGSG